MVKARVPASDTPKRWGCKSIDTALFGSLDAETVGEVYLPTQLSGSHRHTPVTDKDGNLDVRAGAHSLTRRRITADEVRAVEIGDSHAGHEGIVAELLGAAVVVDEAVVLPLDVVQLGVDIAADLVVFAQFRCLIFEAPGNVLVAALGGDAAVLAVHERCFALHEVRLRS